MQWALQPGGEEETQEFDTFTDSVSGASCSLWLLFLTLRRVISAFFVVVYLQHHPYEELARSGGGSKTPPSRLIAGNKLAQWCKRPLFDQLCNHSTLLGVYANWRGGVLQLHSSKRSLISFFPVEDGRFSFRELILETWTLLWIWKAEVSGRSTISVFGSCFCSFDTTAHILPHRRHKLALKATYNRAYT